MHTHQQKAAPKKSPSPTSAAPGRLLQRRCAACGSHTLAGGECPECGKPKTPPQRQAAHQRAMQAALSLASASGLQRKLTIGASNDPLEQEADRVADQVLAAPANPAVSDAPPRIQRYSGQSTGPVDTAPASVDRVLASAGRPLDPATRAFFEPRFGHDFGGVRVHADATAAGSARDVNALAYTAGQNVVFGAGQYAPETPAGRRLMAHELTHVVQQSGSDGTAGTMVRRLQRTCVASPTDRPDRRTVRCDNGAEYRVTLTTTTEPDRPETQTSVNAGYNNQSIFLNVEVCRGGTAVRITPNVDLPRAVGQAIGNILAGSDALTGATLSPGLQITVVQSDGFTLTLGPSVTVDRTGVTGGGLSAEVQTPDITVRGDVTYDAPSRTGFLNFTFSGGSPQQHVACTAQGRQRLVFQCERITHVPSVPEVPEQAVNDTEVRYLFFDYPTANIRRNFRLPTDIQNLYDQGYRVTSINGFTSPEGPRRRERPTFEGNIALSQERADAALIWLRQEACPGCDLSGVTPQGLSELPPQAGAVDPEPRGRAMERAAVDEFLGSSPGQAPDPLAPRDPAEVAAFRRLPRAQQRDRAFELMRRAAIVLQHRRIVQQHQDEVPARDDANRVACEPDVIEAARRSFGISVVTGASPRR